jgi:HlyD family secretion protein
MSANAEIIVEERKEILIIPEKAIIYDKDRNTFAELFDAEAEGQKRRQRIEIGISNGTLTQVTSGLKEGDRVVKAENGGLI